MTGSGRGHGFGAYWAPLLSFLMLVEVARHTPASLDAVLFVLKVAVPLAVWLVYLLRGSYPELRGYRPGVGPLLVDGLVGVAGGFLWMAPYLWSERMRPGPEAAFDPEVLGPGLAWLAIMIRAAGYGLVTPVVEELFARSWLHRTVQAFDEKLDFRDVPIGKWSAAGFAAVVLYWLVSHVSWEAPVAVSWAALTTLWLYHRKHLAALVLVHAASNLTIFATVVLTRGRLDLWFFL